jgi:hypothetical protein
VSECDREDSIMRRPWPTMGCCAMKGGGGGEMLSHDATAISLSVKNLHLRGRVCVIKY